MVTSGQCLAWCIVVGFTCLAAGIFGWDAVLRLRFAAMKRALRNAEKGLVAQEKLADEWRRFGVANADAVEREQRSVRRLEQALTKAEQEIEQLKWPEPAVSTARQAGNEQDLAAIMGDLPEGAVPLSTMDERGNDGDRDAVRDEALREGWTEAHVKEGHV